MIKFFKIFALCFLLLIPSLNMQAAETGECGITTEESGLVVEKESMEICEGDISFTVLYLLFHKIFDQDDVKEIFEGIAPISTNVKQFAAAAGIGDTIVAIFEALTSIIISVATLLISYSVIKVLYKTQTNGEFMGNGKAKVFPVIFNSMFVIFLITPVGSIVMVQLLVLILAVIAIMLGNFFWSTFLYATSVKSSEATIIPEEAKQQASAMVGGIVQTNACMERTNQMLLNQRFKEKSSFDQPNFGFNVDVKIGWGGVSLTTEHDEISRATEKVHECMRYYIKPHKNGDSLMNGYSLTRPELLTCDGIALQKVDGLLQYTGAGAIYNATAESGIVDQINKATEFIYDPNFFGSPHKCGTVTYNAPKIQNMFADDEEEAESQIRSVTQAYNVKDQFDNFSSIANARITSLLSGEVTTALENDLYESYEPMIEELKTAIKEKIAVEEEFNKKKKGKLIYVKAITILNELLGADYSNIGVLDNSGNTEIKPIDLEISNTGEVEEIVDREYHFEFLNTIGARIYDNLEQAHCANKWAELPGSRMTVMSLNEGLENDWYFNDVSSKVNGAFNFECVKLINKKSGESDSERYRYMYNVKLEGFDLYEDIEVDGTNIQMSNLTPARKADILNVLQNNFYPNKIKEVYFDKYLLEGYIYYVKMAVSQALTESLKDLQDDQLLIKLRKDGWATSGAMMLQITMEQGNATIFKQSMTSTGNTVPEVDGIDSPYFASIALNTTNNAGNDSEINESIPLKSIPIAEFIAQQDNVKRFQNKNDVDRMIEDSESGMFDAFLGNIENIIFSPIRYIKQASGLDQDQTIQSGLEECRNEDKVCVSQDTHPLNALMMFGQESMNVALILLLVDVIVQTLDYLVDAMFFDNKEKAGIKDKGVFANLISGIKTVFKGTAGLLATGLIVIIKAIAVFFEFIRPFVFALFGAGVFLGYAVPTIPYVAFAIVFMGWIISIFQTMVALPVLVLFAASSTGQNNLSIMRFWQLTGGILLKPALVTIAIIFGWTLSSISLYYVNATVYSVFSATRPDSIVIGLIHTMLVYVLYVALIYIVVHHAFKVINKMPDEILSLMEVRGSGDSQFIESLNFERFMQAKLATDGVKQIQGKATENIKRKKQMTQQKNRLKILQEQNERERLNQQNPSSSA